MDVAAGTRGDFDPRPMKPDTIVNCFSVTKGIAAACLHLLKQRSLITFEDTIAQHWPEFGCNGKECITIRQLLSHTAGLHRVPGAGTKLAELCNWETMLDKVAKSQPGTTPGKVARYHILSFGWLVGGLVQAITKKHLRDFVRENIAEPLALEVGFPCSCENAVNANFCLRAGGNVHGSGRWCAGYRAEPPGNPMQWVSYQPVLAEWG